MAIDLRYNPAFYPAASSALSLPGSTALADGKYRVETFEEEDEIEGPVWGTGELENIDSKIGESLSLGAGGERVWGTGELQSLGSRPAAASFSDTTENAVRIWGTRELEELSAALPSESSFASPNAAALARRINEERLLDSDDPDTRTFAQDLKAILAGKKEHPSTTGPAAAADQTSDPEPEEAPSPSEVKAYSSSFSHDIFDAMGRKMSMAKTFDLGSYDLSRQLDAFDRQMESEERSAERKRSNGGPAASGSPEAEFAEDLALISGQSSAVPARALETAPQLDLRFDVPLVRQQTGMSCWAAACAMLVAWRDQISVDPSEIARASGAWAQYANGLAAEDDSVFPVWGMTPEPARSYTVRQFYDLLNTYGPLWVASAQPAGPHIRVVTGMTGDGNPASTTLFLNDPGGSQYPESYQQFVETMEKLAEKESALPGAIYVAHLRDSRVR